MGQNHAPSDKRIIAQELNLNKKPNRDSHVSRYRRNTMDTNERIRQGPNKQMSSCTRIVKQKNRKSWKGLGTETPIANSLNLNANSKRPHEAASMNSSI